MRWEGHVARIEEKRNAHRASVGNPERKRPLGRSRHRWMENVNMNLRDICRRAMERTDLAQDRDQWRALVKTAMNLLVP
jgi:hypothetical protein